MHVMLRVERTEAIMEYLLLTHKSLLSDLNVQLSQIKYRKMSGFNCAVSAGCAATHKDWQPESIRMDGIVSNTQMPSARLNGSHYGSY